jgi:hypothetical protein
MSRSSTKKKKYKGTHHAQRMEVIGRDKKAENLIVIKHPIDDNETAVREADLGEYRLTNGVHTLSSPVGTTGELMYQC